MPRKARKLSSTGIYHVVVKGLNSQLLFEESNDYAKYLDIISTHKQECDFNIFAYCLMSNHIHLVIKTNDIPLERVFKKINTHYAIWFNMKYSRQGHLQQERFYSEPVESLAYLLTVIKYVHNNPYKAQLEKTPGQSYMWSSYFEYANDTHGLTDINLSYQYFKREEILNFQNIDTEAQCLDIDLVKKRLPDDVAKNIILEVTSCSNSTEFQNLPILERDSYIYAIHKYGVSIRQINRLTGTSIGSIQRALHKTLQRDGP